MIIFLLIAEKLLCIYINFLHIFLQEFSLGRIRHIDAYSVLYSTCTVLTVPTQVIFIMTATWTKWTKCNFDQHYCVLY